MLGEGLRGSSIYSYALMNSLNDMLSENTVKEIQTDKLTFVSKDGDLFFPVGKNTQRLRDEWWVEKSDKPSKLIDFHTFTDLFIDDEVLTVPFGKDFPISELIEQLLEDDTVYGLIVQDKNNKEFAVNPCHPLVALAIASEFIKLPEEGSLHVFSWKDGNNNYKKIKEVSEEMKNKIASNYDGLIKSISDNLIKKPIMVSRSATVKSNSVGTILDQPFIDKLNIDINIKEKSEGDKDNSGIKEAIIPLQLAVIGRMVPYYGIATITDPSDYEYISGINFTPMLSGNLDVELDNESWNGICANLENVCAGDYNALTFKGWLTLSRVNVDSMYFQSIIGQDEVIGFVQSSKLVASGLWKIINEKEDDENIQE